MTTVLRRGNGRIIQWLLLLLILLVAYALRVYHLEGQSMWSDEGLSLYRLRQPVPELLQNIIIVDGVVTRDTNPPLYFLLLHAWRALTVESVFALRYGGVLLALPAVPLIFRLGVACGSQAFGLAAALLLAVSPFHIWQSQELRNYGLLITLNLLAVYALFRFAGEKKRPWRWLLLWAVTVTLGCYTHYFGFFILAFGTAGLAWVALYRRRGTLQQWRRLAVVGLVGLLLLPGLFVALERFQAGQQVDFSYIPLQRMMQHALSAFAVGVTPNLTHSWDMIWPALLLAGIGLVWLWQRNRVTAVLLLGYQLIPLGLLQLLSLINPLYNGVRHLLIGLPPFILFMAAAITLPQARSWRVVSGGLGLAILAIQLNWLHTQFTAERLVRDDVRGAAVYLTQHATADDLIVLHDTLIGFTFDYYYSGAAPWLAIPLFGQQDLGAAQADLAAAAAATQGRLWFLTEPQPRTGFPRTALSKWAWQNWPILWTRQFSHMWLPVRLEAFVPNPLRDTLPLEATPLGITFANGLVLRGVLMPATLPAGEETWLPLFWMRQDTIEQTPTISLRLIGPDGVMWAQNDNLLWANFPPAHWPYESLVAHYFQVILPAGTPPGEYEVWLRLVSDTGTDVPTADGMIDVPLGVVKVTGSSATPSLPGIIHQQVNLGPVRLLGYRLPGLELRPGHFLPVEVFWQTKHTPKEDYQLRLRLVNGAGTILNEAIAPPTRADYPTTQWEKGMLVQGRIGLMIPGTAVPDDIFLRLALIAPGGQIVGREVTLNEEPLIVPWPLVTDLPPIPRPQVAEFGDPPLIKLQGTKIDPAELAPGRQLGLTLYWQAQRDLSENMVVFIHLSDTADQVVAQADGVPVNGTRLTLSWRAGEVLVDERTLSVPANLAPGTYKLWVGFYDAATQLRLAVRGEGADAPNARVLLATFTWEGE